MKIALAQLNYTVGDVAGNTNKIIESVRRAKAEGADLVVFAEQAISGAPSFDLLRKNPFLEQCEDALMRIAAECDTVDAIVGLPILTKEGTISAAALIQQGRVVRYVGKQNITVRRELGFLTPSKGCEYVTIRGCRCALVVGDDLFHTPDFDKSVETVINIHARRYRKGDLSRRYDVIRNIAYVKGKNVVMVNQVGGATELVYDGMSGVMDNRGKLVRLLKSFEEDFQVFDTENPACSVESVPVSVNDRTRFIYEAACCGLRDFFVKNGYKKACVGVSGGIDSAVVACLAVAALGAENVRGLMMPSQFFVGRIGRGCQATGRKPRYRVPCRADHGGLPQYRRYVDPGDRRYGFRCDGGEYPVPHPHVDAHGPAEQERLYPAQLFQQERECARYLYALRRYRRCFQRDGRSV